MSIANGDLRVYENVYEWLKSGNFTITTPQVDKNTFQNIMLKEGHIIIYAISPPPHQRKTVSIIISKDNPFSKKDDYEKVLEKIIKDGSVDTIVYSTKYAKHVQGIPHVRNILHTTMFIDVRNHVNSPTNYKIIKPGDKEMTNVLYDHYTNNKNDLKKISKIYSDDPFAFWIGADIGDVVQINSPDQETCGNAVFRLVVERK